MRNIRTKKLKTEVSKCLSGAFDESLITIQLERNEKCLLQIANHNFQKAHQLLKQIKKDGIMISFSNQERNIIKSLSLNTEAYCYQKQKKYSEALKCLEEAELLQIENNPIDKARTKLNKSVVLSLLDQHEQAIQLGKSAIEMLKKGKQIKKEQIKKYHIKLYQIMVLTFYNIAKQLSFLSEVNEAHKVFRQGYSLAQKMMGPNHRLTLLLKSVLSKKKSNSQLRNISEGQKSQFTSLKSQSQNVKKKLKKLYISSSKEDQIKKIYISRKNFHTEANNNDKLTTRDIKFYLKSLEKIKNIYSKDRIGVEDEYNSNLKGSLLKKCKMSIQPQFYSRFQTPLDHFRVKNIILKGKSINQDSVIFKAYNNFVQFSAAKQTRSQVNNQLVQLHYQHPQRPLNSYQPQVNTQQITKTEQLPTIEPLPKSLEEKKQEKSTCQLI